MGDLYPLGFNRQDAMDAMDYACHGRWSFFFGRRSKKARARSLALLRHPRPFETIGTKIVSNEPLPRVSSRNENKPKKKGNDDNDKWRNETAHATSTLPCKTEIASRAVSLSYKDVKVTVTDDTLHSFSTNKVSLSIP